MLYIFSQSLVEPKKVNGRIVRNRALYNLQTWLEDCFLFDMHSTWFYLGSLRHGSACVSITCSAKHENVWKNNPV